MKKFAFKFKVSLYKNNKYVNKSFFVHVIYGQIDSFGILYIRIYTDTILSQVRVVAFVKNIGWFTL